MLLLLLLLAGGAVALSSSGGASSSLTLDANLPPRVAAAVHAALAAPASDVAHANRTRLTRYAAALLASHYPLAAHALQARAAQVN